MNNLQRQIDKLKCKDKNHIGQLCGGCYDCQRFWELKDLLIETLLFQKEEIKKMVGNMKKDDTAHKKEGKDPMYDYSLSRISGYNQALSDVMMAIYG